MIPGSGRSPEEGKGYPLQYSWASLVAQLVKNLSTKRETWVRFLGWEDPLEKGKATHSHSGLENSMDYIVHGVAKSWTRLSDYKLQSPNYTSGPQPSVTPTLTVNISQAVILKVGTSSQEPPNQACAADPQGQSS